MTLGGIKVPQMVAAELRRILATPMARLALVALLAVPVLYGGLYLWANQDPYAHFDELPVALVVEDVGVADDDGTVVVRGEEIADQLVADAAFAWHRVDAKAAAAGLSDGTYDFAVTLPSDFSAALASSASDDPRQATVVLRTNDANSFLTTTIGEQAAERIRAAIAEQVGQQAAAQLLDAIAEIRDSLVTAADGAATIADGAASLADGLGQLDDATSALPSGTAALADGAAQVADGDAQLAAIADRVGAAAQEAADTVPQVRAELVQRLQDAGVPQADIDTILAQYDALAADVATANARAQSAVDDIDALADGAAQVADGAAQLAASATTLAAAVTAASDGAAQLADGTAELASGLADGLAQIPATTADERAAQAANIADPVVIDTSNVASAGTYGAGLAPFFASLAAWIGIYALFLIVKPVSKRAITALHSPIRVTLAGWLTPGLLGAIQMTVLFGVLLVVLGFSMQWPIAVLGVMVLNAFVFAAIILALNVWFGSVGQFLGLVLMVLQLVTAGGTFPWQTLPAPLQALHQVLPMGFSTDAMRQIMYGGLVERALGDLLVLAAWMVGALVLAAIGVTRMSHRRTLRDLQPSLIG